MKKILPLILVVIATTGCSDAPDKDAVRAFIKTVYSTKLVNGMMNQVAGSFSGEVADMTADEKADFKADFKSSVQSMTIQCLYDNTDIDGVNWSAVDEVAGMFYTVYQENEEAINNGQVGMASTGRLLQETFGSSKEDMPIDQDVMEEGMRGFQKWMQNSQDCLKQQGKQLGEDFTAKYKE